ncbi:uncharacterized protein LOC114717901 [Neltuma alba]|uniref:uncharacterized protein LOC114717901 n=1 Tax=Neltuma alba TaxID=207710 RepID=UPI0010A478F0|nr:uncharacterized protein LOC114717901 [Prosopis alba]
MGIVYKAISENNWSAVKAFIDRHPQVLNVDFATSMGGTPLHVAAKFGHLRIVEELVALVAQEYLVIRDASGFTPLAIAASHGGAIPVARCLVNKNSIALTIPAQGNWTIPVSLAFISGHKLMGRYLYSVTQLLQVFRPENGQVGPTFLHICLRIGQYDIALHLLQRCTELLFAADSYGVPTIERIAFYVPEYSLNKSQLPLEAMGLSLYLLHYYLKKLMFSHFFDHFWVEDIKTPSTTMTGHFCIDIQEGESNQAGQGIMKEIYEMKLQYAQAAEILKLVCENLMFLNEAKRRINGGAMIEAAKAAEFLLRVTKANPKLISQVTFGHSTYLAFFFVAVECRKAKIFNLLRSFCFKNMAAAMIANDTKNHLLPAEALLAPSSYLNRISGAALQMQREVQCLSYDSSRREQSGFRVPNVYEGKVI